MTGPLTGPRVLTAQSPTARFESRSVVEGEPNATVSVLLDQGAEGNSYFAALWACDPCVLRFAPERDAALVVLQGRARIAFDDGRSLDLGPGDAYAVPRGTWATWHITEPFKEFVTYAA
ncbi:cupin domain-containing protein [Streptomyces sp. NPDC051572]|uniref:cupin domain-containing protein n=1 Tax=unclassified Streptomyces TaxID=2593676 RepID=UPI00344D00B6